MDLTFQYIRRRKHVNNGIANPFTTTWVEKDGTYVPEFANVLVFRSYGVSEKEYRRMEIVRYKRGARLYVKEIYSPHGERHGTVGRNHGDCYGTDFYTEDGRKMTDDDYELIAKMFNIPE